MPEAVTDPIKTATTAAEAFLAEHGDFTFANHGDEYTYGEFITLNTCAIEDAARNNCYIASAEILERVSQETFGGEQLQVIAIANEDTYHAALATWIEDDWYVIDFTARQFNPQLPFPYVAQQHDWKAQIDYYNDNFSAFCSDAGDPSSFEGNETDYWD